MIIEWRQTKKPGDTFVKALGIPALLASALNTTSGISTVNAYVEKNDKITKELGRKSDIPTRPFSPIIGETIIEGRATPVMEDSALLGIPDASAPNLPGASSALGILGISAAHAGEVAAPLMVAEVQCGYTNKSATVSGCSWRSRNRK